MKPNSVLIVVVRSVPEPRYLIVLDKEGNDTMRFNTRGMYRGTIENDGIAQVGIFSEAEAPVTAFPMTLS